ncbi:YncE family protein, partial [Clostridium sp.]|uniref:YncE family protein n=1 Tax=Clostridium sp. TaxID=1506 RepID=UPI003464D64C
DKLSLGAVTNMMGNSVSILDLKTNQIIKEIRVGEYPTKSYIYSSNYFICCESNLGEDRIGRIVIRSLNSGEVINTIMVGKSPIDFYYDHNLDMIFVNNFGEGTISFIDLSCFEEFKRAYVGGMPKGILKNGRFLYVGDNYNNNLIILDIFTNEKKVISIGKDPNGMTFH